MWRTLAQEFWNDLRTQKTRAFLTMIAVTWGTIAVVLMLAFGEGLRDAMLGGLINAGNRVLIVEQGRGTTREYKGLPKGRRIRLTRDDRDALEHSLDGVDLISVSYGRSGVSLAAGKNRETTFMEGVEPQFEEMRKMYTAAGGRFLNSVDQGERRRVLVLGNEIAERLFPEGDPIGKTVELDGLPFTLVGVIQKKLQTSMNNGPDADRAVIPSTTLASVYGEMYVDQILVRPRDITRTKEMKRRVYELLGARHKFDPDDKEALSIDDFIENEDIGRKISIGIQIFLGTIGGLTLLVAGVGVANIMYVAARERTREIGVKLAIGARRSHVVAQFVFEGILLSLSGGLAGLAFSAILVTAVRGIPNKEGVAEFLANPRLSWPVAAITVGALTTIGLLAGFFPARKAASVDPVESLRYE